MLAIIAPVAYFDRARGIVGDVRSFFTDEGRSVSYCWLRGSSVTDSDTFIGQQYKIASEPWFPRHKERDVYLTLMHQGPTST